MSQAMDVQNIERELRDLQSKVAEADARRKIYDSEIRLNRQWNRSLWRLVPPTVIAYLLTVTYYTSVHDIERLNPWLRSIGPVVAISTFAVVLPVIRLFWFSYHKGGLPPRENRSGEMDGGGFL